MSEGFTRSIVFGSTITPAGAGATAAADFAAAPVETLDALELALALAPLDLPFALLLDLPLAVPPDLPAVLLAVLASVLLALLPGALPAGLLADVDAAGVAVLAALVADFTRGFAVFFAGAEVPWGAL